MLQEFIQMPGIYFLHDIFFYFLNEDNKRIISRRVFTVLPFISSFYFCFTYCLLYIRWWFHEQHSDTRAFYRHESVMSCVGYQALLSFTLFFLTTMFLTEDLFIEGFTSSLPCGDVYTWKSKRSSRLKKCHKLRSKWYLQARLYFVAAKGQRTSV